MAAKTILQRLGMTQEELEAKYTEIGNLRATAEELGVSKTTLQKYLSHLTPETKPWSSAKRSSIDYLRRKFRKEAAESLERALLNKKAWVDVNGRTIPQAAIERILVYPPKKMVPLMPVYAQLHDGTNVVFMFHPDVPWVSHQESEPTSAEESHHTSDPAPSTESPHTSNLPEEIPE